MPRRHNPKQHTLGSTLRFIGRDLERNVERNVAKNNRRLARLPNHNVSNSGKTNMKWLSRGSRRYGLHTAPQNRIGGASPPSMGNPILRYIEYIIVYACNIRKYTSIYIKGFSCIEYVVGITIGCRGWTGSHNLYHKLDSSWLWHVCSILISL